MLVRAARCLCETSVCVAIVVLTDRISVKNGSSSVLEKKGEALLDQDESLSAECSKILSEIDARWSKSMNIAFNRTNTKKKISKEDLDEFMFNIANPDFSHLKDHMHYYEDSLSPDQPRVIDEYRAFPSPQLSKYFDRFQIRPQCIVRDVLELCVQREINSSYISDVFDKHRHQVCREMEATAIEIFSPTETLWNNRLQILLQLSTFGLSCHAFNKIWPQHSLSTVFPKFVKAGIVRSLFLSFPFYMLANTFTTSGLSNIVDMWNFIPDSEVELKKWSSEEGIKEEFVKRVEMLSGWDMDGVLEPPIVWPGATRSDPFTPERLNSVLVETPIAQELLFRGLLFGRLFVIGGPAAAHILTMLAFAGSKEYSTDTRATKLNRTENECFALACVTSYFLQRLYQVTGRLILPILMHQLLYYSAIMTEIFTTEGLVYEKMAIWPFALTIANAMESVESSILKLKIQLQRSGFKIGEKKFVLIDDAGQPIAAIQKLADVAMRTFSTDNRRRIAQEDRVLLPEDIGDFWEAFGLAMLKVDNRHPSQKSSWDRSKPILYQRPAIGQEMNLHGEREQLQSLHQKKQQQQQQHERVERDSPTVEVQVGVKHRPMSGATSHHKLFMSSMTTQYIKEHYPSGMSMSQLRENLLEAMLAFDDSLLQSLDFDAVEAEMLHWETASEVQVLDLIQDYSDYIMRFNEESARQFVRIHGEAFKASLGGRKATDKDLKKYMTQFVQYMESSNRRACLCALAPHGLTVRRFDGLVKSRAVASSEIRTLARDWGNYFRTKFKVKVNSIANPFAPQ